MGMRTMVALGKAVQELQVRESPPVVQDPSWCGRRYIPQLSWKVQLFLGYPR